MMSRTTSVRGPRGRACRAGVVLFEAEQHRHGDGEGAVPQ